jgi:hypothetical protein
MIIVFYTAGETYFIFSNVLFVIILFYACMKNLFFMVICEPYNSKITSRHAVNDPVFILRFPFVLCRISSAYLRDRYPSSPILLSK